MNFLQKAQWRLEQATIHFGDLWRQVFRFGLNGRRLLPGQEFKDAKKNLLWICAASFIISISQSNKSVGQAVISGISIHIGALAAGVLLYQIYLFWRFFHETIVVLRFHSCSTADPEKVSGEMHAKMVAVIAEIQAKMDDWRISLSPHQAHKNAAEVMRQIVMEKAQLASLSREEINKKLEDFNNYSDTISENDGETIILNRQKFRHFIVKINECKNSIVSFIESSKIHGDYLERIEAFDLEAQSMSRRSIKHFELLNRSIENSKFEAQKIISLSRDIDASDSRMFALHDVLIPAFFFIVSLVFCASLRAGDMLEFYYQIQKSF